MPSEILSVEDLKLKYELRYNQSRTVRDVFVRLMTHPVETLLAPKDSFEVLKGVTFKVGRGERVGILGVNGSGKTTLCRCIAGLLHPHHGSIRVTGSRRAVFNTQIGVLPELTGRENARLLARLVFPECSSGELDDLTGEACGFSELGTFLDTPYENYSLGMKARLCLSVITARASDLLVIDEMHDNTDIFFKRKLEARLGKFLSDAGAVIFVSHSPELLRQQCNRALVLDEGKIVYDGSVENALNAYRFLRATDGAQA